MPDVASTSNHAEGLMSNADQMKMAKTEAGMNMSVPRHQMKDNMLTAIYWYQLQNLCKSENFYFIN
jgi:hypothetical protein